MSAPLFPFTFCIQRDCTGDSFRIQEGDYHLLCPATKQNWQYIEAKLRISGIPHSMPKEYIDALPNNHGLPYTSEKMEF